MNPDNPKHLQYGLVRDMLATVDIVARFNPNQAADTAAKVARVGRLLMTGEGSSRIFPAKNTMRFARRRNLPVALQTDGARQAQEYKLDDWAVFGLSNSGKTSEIIKLFKDLSAAGHKNLYSLTAFPQSMLESLATKGYVLSCGPEAAVAATKSVVEQAMFYQALLEHVGGKPTLKGQLADLSAKVHQAMTVQVDPALAAKIANAGTIYFAGRNDGVAEELTLKTNEITRKKSDFLEGTYAVHGVEEVMDKNDVVIWIDPFPDSEGKFAEVLAKGVGLTVVAIADRPTPFPTIQVPAAGELSPYVYMAAGWNVLVETGMALGVNLDKPARARKVGNEFVG
ncbi:MAG: SIS domain-containing protein [Tepidisphaerales bacterium]